MEGAKYIKLNEIKVNNKRIEYYFSTSKSFDKYFKEKMMYVEYNYEIKDIPKSILSIPFIANVMPFVWLCDGVLYIDELDKSFYKCLSDVRHGFEFMYPKIEFKGQIQVSHIQENKYESTHEAAQLFSGGLDAITTYIRIREKNPYLITHWGADIRTDNTKVWNVLKSNVEKFAKENGLNNIFVKSNYREFLDEEEIAKDFNSKLGDSWYHGIQHGLSLICSSIPITYKLKIKTIYIGSSYFKGCEDIFGFYPTCGSDPNIDNNIKYGSGNVVHDAYELNRQQKIETVTKYVKTTGKKIFLKVCHNQEVEKNCCNCEKCYRTIFGIIAEGMDATNFGFSIDKNIGNQLKIFLNSNLINISDNISYLWKDIQNKIKLNYTNIKYENIEWLIEYDFSKERRKQIIKYRVKNFIPILKRKTLDIIRKVS